MLRLTYTEHILAFAINFGDDWPFAEQMLEGWQILGSKEALIFQAGRQMVAVV